MIIHEIQKLLKNMSKEWTIFAKSDKLCLVVKFNNKRGFYG